MPMRSTDYWTLQATASTLGTCYTADPCIVFGAFVDYSGNASLILHDSDHATAPAPVRFPPIRTVGSGGVPWGIGFPIRFENGLSVSLSGGAACVVAVIKRT